MSNKSQTDKQESSVDEKGLARLVCDRCVSGFWSLGSSYIRVKSAAYVGADPADPRMRMHLR